MKDDLSPVLIVGGGPVGLTTGISLRRYGVPCRVIEQRTAPSDTSRGLMLTPASLHIYDRLGVAQILCEHAYRVAHANLYWRGRRMYRLPFGAMPTPFNYLLMRPQPETERILLDRYLALGGCYEAGVELRTLRADANGVEVELQGPSGMSRGRYAYVVGADGSRSTVRRALDIPTVQEKPDFMRFVLGDFKVSWPSGDLGETHYFVSDEGFMIVLPLKPGYHRVFFKGPGARTQVVLDAHWFQAMARVLAPSDFVLSDPIWVSSVPHHAKVAQQFRQGRVYLVGDAAHSFSPMGGQGMNTGIQDAFNLSWKLALRCRGLGSERLLDSFHTERHGAATAVTTSVMSNTRLICREDCDPQGPLKSFLPRRENVKFLRHLLPRLMSGLATTHSQGAFAKQLLQLAAPLDQSLDRLLSRFRERELRLLALGAAAVEMVRPMLQYFDLGRHAMKGLCTRAHRDDCQGQRHTGLARQTEQSCEFRRCRAGVIVAPPKIDRAA